METSMLKTLAGKHRSTVTKMSRKYKSTIERAGFTLLRHRILLG
jgi:hypothetical protein